MPKPRIVVGLMSGTSMDGIDAAVCRIMGRGTSMQAAVLTHVYRPFPASMRGLLLRMAVGESFPAETYLRVDIELGRCYAVIAGLAIRRAKLTPRDVHLIGCHGQTICHQPASRLESIGGTWQIGQTAVISAKLGIPVVGHFREADMAVGGQGAPLVPWTDYVLLRDRHVTRCVQNVGGIANVTFLPAGGDVDSIRAFDTGPGNMVIDGLAAHLSKGRWRFDKGGRLAASGRVCEPLLQEWLSHPYFRRRPPKSCGREEFGYDFWQPSLRRWYRSLTMKDFLATATRLTARSIADAYRLHLRSIKKGARQIVLCGGGALNLTLRQMLESELSGDQVRTIDQYGIGMQVKEALSFALLACACVDGVSANLPRVTGARRAVILGQIAPAAP